VAEAGGLRSADERRQRQPRCQSRRKQSRPGGRRAEPGRLPPSPGKDEALFEWIVAASIDQKPSDGEFSRPSRLQVAETLGELCGWPSLDTMRLRAPVRLSFARRYKKGYKQAKTAVVSLFLR
jgi:hypothetical protein